MTDLSWRDDDIATWGDDWSLSPDQVPAISQLRRRKRRRGLPPDQVPKKQAAYPETPESRHRRNYRLKGGGLYLARGNSRRAAPPKISVHESKKPGYTKDDPPAKAADTPASLGMRDGDFDIAAKKAKAERTASARLANYQFLARTVDLENPALALAEQRRRANRLLTAYGRVQEVKRDFTDNNIQLTAARRIQKAAYREGQRVKRPPAPRGRPRKHLHV
jgi:hypothetical protein